MKALAPKPRPAAGRWAKAANCLPAEKATEVNSQTGGNGARRTRMSGDDVRRRRVTMHVEDITEHVKEWSQGTRLEFNRKLSDWYNEKNEDVFPRR